MTQPYVTAHDLYHIVQPVRPRFSPDGQWLAYVRTGMDRQTNGYKSAIWLTPAGTARAETASRQFTSGDKRDSAPRWSPDGRWLAFVSDRGDDKAKAQHLPHPHRWRGGPPPDRPWRTVLGEPAWSPDGKRLAFTSRRTPKRWRQEVAAEDEPETRA